MKRLDEKNEIEENYSLNINSHTKEHAFTGPKVIDGCIALHTNSSILTSKNWIEKK